MRIRLIVATDDTLYADRLYSGAVQQRNDVEVSICTDYRKLDMILESNFYDVCLVESAGIGYVDRKKVKLLLHLLDNRTEQPNEVSGLQSVEKYQRVSTLLSQVISAYAHIAQDSVMPGRSAQITVVWSPAGGVGKTTLALAKAVAAVQEQKRIRYLNLEYFCATPVLLQPSGNSLSAVFEEMLGNVALQIQGIQNMDPSTGISYFGQPTNFDDLNTLTCEEMIALIRAAQTEVDELIIDLSSVCDRKTTTIFEIADKILLVTDNTRTAECKLKQFIQQHNVYRRFASKMQLIANKGAAITCVSEISVIRLPYIQSGDPVLVYKKLAVKDL